MYRRLFPAKFNLVSSRSWPKCAGISVILWEIKSKYTGHRASDLLVMLSKSLPIFSQIAWTVVKIQIHLEDILHVQELPVIRDVNFSEGTAEAQLPWNGSQLTVWYIEIFQLQHITDSSRQTVNFVFFQLQYLKNHFYITIQML